MWKRRKSLTQKKRKRKSLRSEKRGALDLGGRLTPNSGAQRGWFGDFYSDDLLVEDKYRSAHCYRLTSKDWQKLCKGAAIKGGKIPVFRVTIGSEEPIAILDSEDWNEMGQPMTVPNPTTKAASIRIDLATRQQLDTHCVRLITSIGDFTLVDWDRFVKIYKEDQC